MTALTINLTLYEGVYLFISTYSCIYLLKESGHHQLVSKHVISYHLYIINKIERIIKCQIDSHFKISNALIHSLIRSKSKTNTNSRETFTSSLQLIIYTTVQQSRTTTSQTYNKRQTQQDSIAQRMIHLLSLLYLCFCFKTPPHLLQNQQQQRQQPVIINKRAKAGPRTVTRIMGVHHSPNCIVNNRWKCMYIIHN